ncbi:alpha/beta hydrolase [Natronospirillum operosum]|uniref:Alpha/beta hydrolase n=2 Tax=Natronospirillum operosum TaxID=2759953 RepID=A0A4Z0W739_9GAMM|nr:alpha/beta hydrolase [Natronospirillum operosum]
MDSWELPEVFDYQGRSVRYGIVGDGPPLVCVHGTPWSSFNLRHLIGKLSEHYTVYFHDLLGYGQSSKQPGDVSLGIQNEVLNQLLDHWGLENPIIVGHDFGGATSLRTHLLNGRRFEKMVLIDPVAIAPWGSPFFRHVNEHEAAFSGIPDYIHEAIVRAYVQTAAFRELDEQTLEGIVRPWTGEEGKPAFYRQIAQANQRYTDEVQRLYAQVSVPVLILWGREDSWVPLAKGQELESLIPGSTLRVVDDAGHLVIEEKPTELFDEMLSFLRT